MLGALGNINRIADTVIHAMIYKYLIELFEIMVKIRSNQGVAVDNTFTPPPPGNTYYHQVNQRDLKFSLLKPCVLLQNTSPRSRSLLHGASGRFHCQTPMHVVVCMLSACCASSLAVRMTAHSPRRISCSFTECCTIASRRRIDRTSSTRWSDSRDPGSFRSCYRDTPLTSW